MTPVIVIYQNFNAAYCNEKARQLFPYGTKNFQILSLFSEDFQD